MNDSELIGMVLAGNEAAYAELMRRYRTKVLSIAKRITRNHEDAEDVAQLVFLAVYRNLSKFSGDSKFPTWLHRIAVNQSLMLLRRRGTNREVQYEENDGNVRDYPDPAPTPEQAYAHRQMRDQLRAAVSGMPRTLSEVLEKYNTEDLPLEKVAEDMGISLAAAKTRLLRARIAVRSSMCRPMRAAQVSSVA